MAGARGVRLRELFRWPSPLERDIARRYLRSRRSSGRVSLITAIATGGVAVGVCALIVVLGVMNGLRNDLRERILVANPHLRVLTYGNGLRMDDWRHVVDVVRAEPGVLAAAPEVLTQSVLSAGADYAEGVNVLGMEGDTGSQAVTTLPQAITRGDLTFRATRPEVDGGIVLGSRLAERMTVYPGDVVTLVPAKPPEVNRALGIGVPRYWKFEVTGTFETGMFLYDNQFVLIARETAQRFTGLGDAVSGVQLRLADPWQAPAIGRRLEEKLGYPYRALDWQTQNSTLFSALKLEKLAMGLVIFFIMVVAGFNIVGTLTMVVAEKTREIGILRAMGLPAGAVGRIFLAQGAIVGLVGVGLGLVSGLGIALLVDRGNLIRIDPSVYFVDHIPVHVEALDVVLIVVASLVLAIVATVPPSRGAARLEPVEAIRHE
ncbi:MAG: ABC transporter permease [Gemmatimonadetes bacterium]|nr:ABC transporter permease [Gemmatimonadota bacterium]MBP6667968.1 ABC transporter permease [Gemmatimonadales bacterium]MBK6778950.1 ABC transporter permease [Gemmatimonadota bacterium]MBK7348740.1 ABC transporter permease [Gemmatimonadota bacterium]MBK7714305.1 ABC transporter permease [Gemmatimonadota bacterium]